MVNWKEAAKTNRFVAAVKEIHDISMNKNPINNTGDVVDAGVALDMYINAKKINRLLCFKEYAEFKRMMKGVSFNLETIIEALSE